MFLVDRAGQPPLVVSNVYSHASKEAARNKLARELVRLSSKTGRQRIVTGDFKSLQKEGEMVLCLANGPATHWDGYFDDFALLHTRQRE